MLICRKGYFKLPLPKSIKSHHSITLLVQCMKTYEKNQNSIKEFIEFREASEISPRTLESDHYCLQKLASYYKTEDITTLDKKQLQQFFKDNKKFSYYNLCGNKLKLFYRWIDDNNDIDIGKRECPRRMKWFTYQKTEVKDQHKRKEEELITDEEYQKIIDGCKKDKYGMWEACWETFWFSGARLGEISSMQIKHVKFDGDKCTIYVPQSKTDPREIPLPEYPYLLERWIHTHPDRDNQEAPLWISFSASRYGKKLNPKSISVMFWKLRNKLGLKDTLSVHNFRKTRATKMFNARRDGALIYGDKDMALFFGWKLSTVTARREQYDLNGYEELRDTVFNNKHTGEDSYDIQKKKYDKMKTSYEGEINTLKQQMVDMQKQFQEAMGLVKQYTN